MSLLIGDEGIGKSLLWVLIVAHITTGKPLPGFGIPARDPGRVMLVITEDDWSTAVLPRLKVAGADLDMIRVICVERDGSGAPIFPRDMGLVRNADPRPDLVVVDCWLDTVPPELSVKDSQQALADTLIADQKTHGGAG
ncbi:AAA family ATPase [Mycobacterium sp. E1715]|uniref:AAA family ATPase n=1 Tax=Mycobacterium sp. E1715 TaxID=1856863 RepID=UPI0009ED1781|nr:AAA family ATPase [Mycobacterium sp. E1715]